MILNLLGYLKDFSTVSVVTEDLLLKCFPFSTFLLLFMSLLVTGKKAFINPTPPTAVQGGHYLAPL